MSAGEMLMLEDAPCGYVEVGPDGLVVTANHEFLKLAGRDRDDVVGTRTFSEMLSAGGRIYYETHYRPTLQMSGEIREIALDLLRPDGSKVPILVSANLVTDEDGTETATRTIVFGAGERRLYEQELLRTRRAAQAAEARAHALAQTLQQTFIPPTMPHVPGLAVSGAYRPAGDGSEVGGDFYDVFQIRDGEWVVALGDVSGKGVDAAVVTAFVRHSIRALALQHDDPSDVLRALNDALLAHRTDRFCTVLLLRLLRDDDEWLVAISSGGHPLPLLLSADGTIVEIGAAGSLLGVLPHPQLDDARDTIVAGDRLLLYTDGVTDARTDQGPFGLDGLLEVLAEPHASASATTKAVLERVLDFQDGEARDDIAIVALEALADDSFVPDPPSSQARMEAEEKNEAIRLLARLAESESPQD